MRLQDAQDFYSEHQVKKKYNSGKTVLREFGGIYVERLCGGDGAGRPGCDSGLAGADWADEFGDGQEGTARKSQGQVWHKWHLECLSWQ